MDARHSRCSRCQSRSCRIRFQGRRLDRCHSTPSDTCWCKAHREKMAEAVEAPHPKHAARNPCSLCHTHNRQTRCQGLRRGKCSTTWPWRKCWCRGPRVNREGAAVASAALAAATEALQLGGVGHLPRRDTSVRFSVTLSLHRQGARAGKGRELARMTHNRCNPAHTRRCCTRCRGHHHRTWIGGR